MPPRFVFTRLALLQDGGPPPPPQPLGIYASYSGGLQELNSFVVGGRPKPLEIASESHPSTFFVFNPYSNMFLKCHFCN